MKIRYFLSLAVILLVLGAASCKKDPAKVANENLQKAVKELTLPASLKDGSSLTECSFQDNVLTFVCNVDSKNFNKIDSEKSKEKTVEELKTGLFPQNLIKNVVAAGATIKYELVNGSDTVCYEIAPSELQKTE